MLTAKHIDIEGNETLYEVIRVRAIPNPEGGKQPIEVITVEPNGHTNHYKSGRIFVMNEAGSTVSNWIIIDEEEAKNRIGKSNHPAFGTNFLLKKDLHKEIDKFNRGRR